MPFNGAGVAGVIHVAKGAMQVAGVAVPVRRAKALAGRVQAERRAVGGAAAAFGALCAVGAGRARQALAAHVVAPLAGVAGARFSAVGAEHVGCAPVLAMHAFPAGRAEALACVGLAPAAILARAVIGATRAPPSTC